GRNWPSDTEAHSRANRRFPARRACQRRVASAREDRPSINPKRRERSLSGFARRQLSDKGPGHLRNLTVVVNNFEVASQFFIDLHAHWRGSSGDPVGFANRGMRFEETEPVFELHVEDVLPAEIAC